MWSTLNSLMAHFYGMYSMVFVGKSQMSILWFRKDKFLSEEMDIAKKTSTPQMIGMSCGLMTIRLIKSETRCWP